MRAFGMLIALYLTMGCMQNSGESATICKLGGINDFRFGMSWEEAKEIDVQWDTSLTLPSSHKMQIGPWVGDGYLSFSKDNKLLAMMYYLKPQDLFINEINGHMLTYLQVKSLLTSKYGKPIIDKQLDSIYDLLGLPEGVFFDWIIGRGFIFDSYVNQHLCMWEFQASPCRIWLILYRDDKHANWLRILLIYSNILAISDDSTDVLFNIF